MPDFEVVRRLAALEDQVERLRTIEVPNDKVFGGRVNGGHSDFATAQDAIDWAVANSYYHVYFPVGTYGNISITTNSMTIEGASTALTIFEDTAGHCIEVDAVNVTLRTLRVEGTAGGGNAYDAIHVNNGANRCMIAGVQIQESDRYGIYSDAVATVVVGSVFSNAGNFDSSQVYLDTSSDDCVVVGNGNLDGGSSDNGSGNVVANNS